ncbi:MAG: hypothetical protein WCV81_00565 [Microgenomates group bacterium]|jgi:hypothetical protein
MNELTSKNRFAEQEIKKGHYGVVSLVKLVNSDPQTHSDNIISRLVNKFIAPHRIKRSRHFDRLDLANYILSGNKVWESDIEQIPKGKNYEEQLQLADIFVTTSIFNEQLMEAFRYSHSPIMLPTGHYLADFLEVIPTQVSSRIVFAASDPSIARDLLTGKGLLDNTTHNSQSLAIEAIVLLPSNIRQEIFQEMVNISPSETNHTHRFLNLISLSWNDHGSKFCVPSLIRSNLDSDFSHYADHKIAEVWNDIPFLRGIVESAK